MVYRVVAAVIAVVMLVVVAYALASGAIVELIVFFGTLIVVTLLIVTSATYVVPPTTVLIIRDRFNRIVRCCDTGTQVIIPLVERRSEEFTLSWRTLELVDDPFDTADNLEVRVSTRIFFTVDPRSMKREWIQILVDSLGSDQAKWEGYLRGCVREAMNALTIQYPLRKLMSRKGQEAFCRRLIHVVSQNAAGTGMRIENVQLYRIEPSAEAVSFFNLAAKRAQRTKDYQAMIPGIRSALGADGVDPMRFLDAVGMLDVLLSRESQSLYVNMAGPFGPQNSHWNNEGNGDHPNSDRGPFDSMNDRNRSRTSGRWQH